MTPMRTEPTGAESDVLRADDRRFEAMRKGDWAALEAVLAEDLTYVNSTARLESKAEHVANLRAGHVAANRDLALRLARHRHAPELRILQGPAGRQAIAALHRG